MCGIWGASADLANGESPPKLPGAGCDAHMDVIVCLPHLPFREHVPIRKASLSPQERSQL